MHTRNPNAAIAAAANANHLNLTGVGAAYLRVSTSEQDADRQREAINRWLTGQGLSINARHVYVDEGWERDTQDVRPAFQRLIADAEAGRVNWIVVDVADRFGMKNERKLVVYIDRLIEAGCRLVTVDNDELTTDDLMTFFKLGMSGRKSREEQETKSKRVLEAKIMRAKRGEWGGGQIPYGMDVVCFDATATTEKWRVEFAGRTLVGRLPNGKRKYDTHRVKINRDGSREAYDGWRNFPASDRTDILQLRPSHDPAKVAVVREVFETYAHEAINPTQLARRLNAKGIKPTYSDRWTCNMVASMLQNPSYIGRPATNKMGQGRFYEYVNGERRPVDAKRRDRRRSKTDWVLAEKPTFDPPMIPLPVWEAVQAKVDGNPAQRRAPKSPTLWLSRLVYCAGCGKPMRGYALKSAERYEYICSSYAHGVEGCTCKRNSVAHAYVEEVVTAYLEDAGETLDGLDTGSTEQLRQQFWDRYKAAFAKVVETERRMEEVAGIGEDELQRVCRKDGKFDFVALNRFRVDAYRAKQAAEDAPTLEARRRELEAELDRLTDAWTTLPTPRAKEKAKTRLEAVEAELQQIEDRQKDVATEYEQLIGDVTRIGAEWEAARASMGADVSARRRAEAVGKVVARIECHFEPTGQYHPSSRLTKIEVIPHEYPADDSGCRGGGLRGRRFFRGLPRGGG